MENYDDDDDIMPALIPVPLIPMSLKKSLRNPQNKKSNPQPKPTEPTEFTQKPKPKPIIESVEYSEPEPGMDLQLCMEVIRGDNDQVFGWRMWYTSHSTMEKENRLSERVYLPNQI